ncbi:MAG: gliding motility-associated C-terminal domain-containing protein [Cyclobacteriaceae bacterium]
MLAGNLRAQNLGSIEGNQINYPEGESPVLVTDAISVSGNAPISFATIAFASGYEAGEDTLMYEGDSGLFPVFNEEEGILYLLSYPAGTTRTSAEVQAALRSVYYQNTNEANPKTQGRSIAFTVFNKEEDASNTLSRNIVVRGENDPPTLRSPSNAPVVVNSLIEAVTITEDLIVGDPDDNIIVGATVEINQSRFGDQLNFGSNSNDNIQIQPVENSNNRSLVLSGRDSRENYQKALRAISISNIFTAQGFKGNRLITMQITDEDGTASTMFSQYVHVSSQGNGDNIPPSVKDISGTTQENKPFVFQQQQFLQAYEDAGQSQFDFIRILSLPAHGYLTLDGTVIDADYIVDDNGVVDRVDLNNLRYTPNEGFTGTDSFEWNATDGTDFAANPALVSINVQPLAIPLSITVPDGAQVDEDGITILPPITVTSTPTASINVKLAVENGQLFLNPLLLPFINFSDDNQSGSALEFTASAQVITYVLSGLQYQPNTNVSGSDLLNITVASAGATEEGVLSITIIPIDDPIVLSNIEPDTLIYQENDVPLAITNELVLSDPDGATAVVSATITVLEGFDTSQDSITYTLTGGVSAQRQDNQVLFTGESSLSQYQSILRSVAYQNTSDNPTAGFRTFEFVAKDENDSISNTVFRTLTVVPVDDSTFLSTAESDSLNFVLGSDPVPLAPTLTLTDVDSDSLTRLTVTFEIGYDPNVDTLLVELPDGMSASWDDAEGVLLIEGKNSLEVYQTIIRSLQYRYATLEAQPDREVIIQVFNEDTPSNPITRIIILVENEPPLLTDFEKKLVQNDSLSFSSEDFLAYYNDPDNFPSVDRFSSLRIVVLPTQGALLVSGDTITQAEIDAIEGGFFINSENIAQLKYIPNPDYTGTDQFGWNAFDGAELAQESASVNLTIVPALSITLSEPIEICPGETVPLSIEVLTGEAPYTYAWTCDQENCRITTAADGATISVNPIETTSYIFRIESAEGLDSIQDTITVSVLDCSGIPLEIPSAFTPNEDNINDQWIFPNAAIFSSIQVEVYDRFGHTVFQSTNYQNNWNGTYEGDKLPTGTYYYQVVVNQGLQEHTGTVTLLQ